MGGNPQPAKVGWSSSYFPTVRCKHPDGCRLAGNALQSCHPGEARLCSESAFPPNPQATIGVLCGTSTTRSALGSQIRGAPRLPFQTARSRRPSERGSRGPAQQSRRRPPWMPVQTPCGGGGRRRDLPPAGSAAALPAAGGDGTLGLTTARAFPGSPRDSPLSAPHRPGLRRQRDETETETETTETATRFSPSQSALPELQRPARPKEPGAPERANPGRQVCLQAQSAVLWANWKVVCSLLEQKATPWPLKKKKKKKP